MPFHPIDLTTWKRKSYYEHYMNNVRCTYSVTLNIEVDGLVRRIKSRAIRTYPVQIYMVSRVVNSFPEFRMAKNRDGQLGCWDFTNPCYTIFNKVEKTFSSICTPFNRDFDKFYAECNKDIETYSDSTVLFPQNGLPENLFNISSLPWLGFTAFNLNVHGEGNYLPPIFTLGRHLEEKEKTYMPLSIQVHHAVCDGYHVGKFVEALQEIATNYGDWLSE